MEKLKAIISGRDWYHTSEPLIVFENRLKDMTNLQVSTISSNIPESSKNEANKQYLIMLVTCYETYIRDIFKKLIDKSFVSMSELMSLNRLMEVKFTLDEVEFIKNKNIKLSELVCEYINFQNFGIMMKAFSVINLDNEIERKLKKKDGIMPLPDSALSKDVKDGSSVIHKNLFNKKQLYHQINLLLKARHKIIHNNIDIAISQKDINIMTLAVYEFVMILDRVLQDIEKKKKSKLSSQ